MQVIIYILIITLLTSPYKSIGQNNKELPKACHKTIYAKLYGVKEFEEDCEMELGTNHYFANLSDSLSLYFSTRNGEFHNKAIVTYLKDTINILEYDYGVLLQEALYDEKGELSFSRELKDSIYEWRFHDFEDDWFVEEEYSFNSKSLELKVNKNDELLDIRYIDENNSIRCIVDYENNLTKYYDELGKITDVYTNYLKPPKYKDNSQLSPKAFGLKEFPYKNDSKEWSWRVYKESGSEEIVHYHYNESYIDLVRIYDINGNLIEEKLSLHPPHTPIQ